MRIVQDYLRELDRVKLMDAYFKYAQDDMEDWELYDEEQRMHIKYSDTDGIIQYLVDLKPEAVGNGKTYILFAYPDCEMSGHNFKMSHTLVCKEDLLASNERVGGHIYDTSSQAEILGFYVSDAPYTKEHIYELMGQVLSVALEHGPRQECLEMDYEELKNVKGIWYKNEAEYLDVLQGRSMPDESLYSAKTDEMDSAQMKHWWSVLQAVANYKHYCYDREQNVLRELLQKDIDAETLISTGYPKLDEFLGGLRKGDLVLLGSRPAMGKGLFAINIMNYLMLTKNIPCLYYSLQRSKKSFCERLFNIGGDKICERVLDTETPVLYVEDSLQWTVEKIYANARMHKKEHNIGFIVIDYVQLLSLDCIEDFGLNYFARTRFVFTEIAMQLKELALELDVPVLVLSTLSRSLEYRDDKRPVKEDIKVRDCGLMEEYIDLMMFLYRDDYYNRDVDPEHNNAEVIVAKNNKGPTGTVKMNWRS